MCNVRLEWTFDEFYASGGTTSFADRIAAALGIHASTVKVASVYEGSIVVDFYIEAEDDDEEPEETLSTISENLATQLNEGSIDLGAPILEVSLDSSFSSTTTSSESSGREEEEEEVIVEVEYIDIIIEEQGSTTTV